jgi:hypothetical protein
VFEFRMHSLRPWFLTGFGTFGADPLVPRRQDGIVCEVTVGRLRPPVFLEMVHVLQISLGCLEGSQGCELMCERGSRQIPGIVGWGRRDGLLRGDMDFEQESKVHPNRNSIGGSIKRTYCVVCR